MKKKINHLKAMHMTAVIISLSIVMFAITGKVFSQCQPYIKVDGNIVMANQTVATGLTLPLWLKEGQTIAVSQMVNSISIIEFTVNGTALEFSQVISVTSSTPQAVPTGKVWKVESIVKQPTAGTNNSVSFLMAGTNTFTVPSCAGYICIEVWGGGGGGQGNASVGGGGGGGGGYGQGCFSVTPGTSYSVTVGAGGTKGASSGGTGGTGGTSSVGSLISATGGSGGTTGGGNGGTSTAPVSIAGFKGAAGTGSCYGGAGGYGGNGGAGGAGGACDSGFNGTSPGGGGGGAGTNSGNTGGAGAAGKVIITW